MLAQILDTLPALVVGPAHTAQQRADLAGFAFDVVDQLVRPAVVATSSDYCVTDFAFVVSAPDLFSVDRDRYDTAGITLYAEALAAGMTVFEVDERDDVACAHCGVVMTIAPTNERGVPCCVPCLEIGAGCSRCGSVGEDCEPVQGADGALEPSCGPCVRTASVASSSALAVSA